MTSEPSFDQPPTMGEHYLVTSGRAYVPVGAHLVPPSGPDWPWRVGPAEFDRAFATMAAAGLTTVRIDVIWAALEPEAGRIDQAHLDTLDEILAAARRHRLWLHPALFVGGEVGDAVWEPDWVQGRNPHNDSTLLQLQHQHAAALAHRWSQQPGIIAWDLSDEPPAWLHQATTTDQDAEAWVRLLADALREHDPGRLVTVGTASQEVDHGPFRADVVAPQLDFACVHPYPIYSPELYPDDLLSVRMTHAGAFETALAAGAGRPVMIHEYGASSTQFDPDEIAAYDRLLCWAGFGRGAIGFYAWCWSDAEPSAYSRAPYVRMPHETQFGATTHDFRPRPRLEVLSELAAAMAALDVDTYAGHGPLTQAGLMVPYEYAHPYDPASYGLDAEPAGPYLPAERAWYPDRDVKPLIRAWLNEFVLAARAGVCVEFPRERLDHVWPDLPLLLAPAPLTSTTSSLLHLRTSWWSGAADFHDRGGVLYISLSAETAIPDLDALAGVRVVGRAPVESHVHLHFTAAFGTLVAGDVLSVPAGRADLHGRGVRLKVEDAEVLAVDSHGNPALTRVRRGTGYTVVCAYPVEILLADVPDAHGPEDPWWQVLHGLADLAGIVPLAGVEHPDLTTGLLHGSGGGTLVVTNHGSASVRTTVRLPQDAAPASGPQLVGSSFDPESLGLEIAGHAAALITWNRRI